MTKNITHRTIIIRTAGLGLFAFSSALPLAAQVPGSALDHMLQRPKVAKHFEDKHFGDRFFLEAFGSANTTVSKFSPHTEKASFTGGIALGDWVTPLHGWRIGFRGGNLKYQGTKPSVFNASADYLLNITALSIPTFADSTYSHPRTFELHALAGIDMFRASLDGNSKNALGVHFGLRGLASLSSYTYFFVEPRVGVASDNVVFADSWRGHRFTADISAGLGYRVTPSRQHNAYATDGNFLDDTFISISAGPSAIINADEGNMGDFFGAAASGYIGKWFSPYSGVRLGAHAATYKQPGAGRVKALGLTAGYLWNMHNTFGGYTPDRRFWLNFVADAGINASASGNGKHWTPGGGGGIQANFRLGQGAEFFLEPRVDLAKENYAMYANSSDSWDIMASLKSGFTFRQGLDTRRQLKRNDDFEQKTIYDNIFFEGGIGGALVGTSATMGHPFDHVRPKVFAGVGKWFTATDGVRLWTEAVQYEMPSGRRRKAGAVGADYLWNITNAFHGYNPDRHFELVGAVGANLSRRSGRKKLYAGLNAGVKGIWHANNLLAFFVEPQLRLYGKNYLPEYTTPGIRMDATGSMIAGMQVTLGGYAPVAYRETFAKADRKAFFSVAGGMYSPTRGIRNSDNYGFQGRLSYGTWYTPISAWRLNLNGQTNPRHGYRYALVSVGGDYILDGTAMAYGFDEDRAVSLRGVAGLNVGIDYGKGDTHFASDIHAGGQLAFRAGNKVEIYAEPQLAYRLDNKYYDTYLKRFQPTMLVGLNYRMRAAEDKPTAEAPEKSRFISASIGTGLHSSTVTAMSPGRRKLTLDYAVAYGEWLNAKSGWRIVLADATIQKRGKGNQHVTALQADCLINFLTLGGQTLDETGFRLNGFVGGNLSVGSREGYSPTWAPGVQAGVQAGWAITPSAEIYLEPSGTINAKTLIRNSSHPAEAAMRLMIGTKINF